MKRPNTPTDPADRKIPLHYDDERGVYTQTPPLDRPVNTQRYTEHRLRPETHRFERRVQHTSRIADGYNAIGWAIAFIIGCAALLAGLTVH